MRLAFRTSRWFWLIWVLALWSFIPATAKNYRTVIADDAAGAEVAKGLAANPTMRAMLGPPFDLMHIGSFTMFRVGGFTAMLAGIMTVLGVIRLTRAEEESGRTELIRAGAVGRHSTLTSAVTLALIACGTLALLIAGSMAGLAQPLAGAVCMGLGVGLTGAVFAGVGAVAAQLTASARSARFIGLGVLGASYLVRALADGGDQNSAWVNAQWISPVEWAALARPYAGERWWVLGIPVIVTVVLIGAAFVLESRRDFASGLWPARPGPASAAAGLRNAGALAWRLHRGTIVAWTVGLAVFSLAIGSLSGTFDTLGSDNPELAERFRRMGGGAEDLRKAFYVAMLGIMITVVTAFALQLADRLRREEGDRHAEAVLATATSRLAFARSHLVPALLVPSLVMLACGALIGAPGGQSLTAVGAAAALLPGLWLLVGLSMALQGTAPRMLFLAWTVLAWSVFISWLGALLNLPRTVLDATPFAQLPQLPVQTMTWPAVVIETVLALGLIALGLWGYRRRDIA